MQESCMLNYFVHFLCVYPYEYSHMIIYKLEDEETKCNTDNSEYNKPICLSCKQHVADHKVQIYKMKSPYMFMKYKI